MWRRFEDKGDVSTPPCHKSKGTAGVDDDARQSGSSGQWQVSPLALPWPCLLKGWGMGEGEMLAVSSTAVIVSGTHLVLTSGKWGAQITIG